MRGDGVQFHVFAAAMRCATCAIFRTWIADMSYIRRRDERLPWRSMDNDGMHKFAYRHLAMFADLLRLAAPALDFARAELLPTSHVATADARFKQRHGDMAWRVPHRHGKAQDGSPLHLIVVLECPVDS